MYRVVYLTKPLERSQLFQQKLLQIEQQGQYNHQLCSLTPSLYGVHPEESHNSDCHVSLTTATGPALPLPYAEIYRAFGFIVLAIVIPPAHLNVSTSELRDCSNGVG